ncbi:MAG: ThiF family adenylyltransferase [Proteobacteria bacterium]|nr:ThiF family adenylyltransferase [Pseudomonadota bacterium]
MDEKINISIVGAGGIGNPLLLGLSQSALPNLHINIFDDDLIALSNLPRQILFTEEDINKQKAVTLKNKIQALGKNIRLHSFAERITSQNIEALLLDSTIVIDATDSVETKFLINDFCVNNKITFCYAGAVGYEAQFLLCDPKNKTNGCVRCLFGEFKSEDYDCQNTTCQQAGILGPVVGFVGFAVAQKILEFLSNPNILLESSLFCRFNLENDHLFFSKIKATDNCPFCFAKDRITSLNIRDKKCPSTFLYSKMAIEKLQVGDLLEIRLAEETIAENVSRSLEAEGHKIIRSAKLVSDSDWRIIFEKTHNV